MPAGQLIFEDLAAGYALSRPAVHPLVIERIRRRLWPASHFTRALDVGCGAGISTQPLTQVAGQVFGIEVAEPMLGWCSRIAPQAHFAVGHAEELPIRSASIGLLTAAGSLNYADLDCFFPEAARVLEPGGMLVVYDFSPGRTFGDSESTLERWFAAFMQRYPPPSGDAIELNPRLLAEWSGLFQLYDQEEFAIGLNLSPAFYVEYVLTETNVARATRTGVPLEEIRDWCRQTLAPVFGGQSREVLFRGYIAYLTCAVTPRR